VTEARSIALSVPKWCSNARLRVGPDARDLLQAGLAQIARAARPVRAYGETMGLVAQPLDKIEDGIARRQLERVAAGEEEGFATGIAIRALGDSDKGNIGAQRRNRLPRRIELACPPSISTRSGHGDSSCSSAAAWPSITASSAANGTSGPSPSIPARRLGEKPLEAALQNLAHHGEIIAGLRSAERMLNLRYWLLRKPSGPATIIAPTAFEPWMWLLS